MSRPYVLHAVHTLAHVVESHVSSAVSTGTSNIWRQHAKSELGEVLGDSRKHGTTLPFGASSVPLSVAMLADVRRSIEARRNLVCCEAIEPGESVLVIAPFAQGEAFRFAQQFVTHDGRLTIGKDTVDFIGDLSAFRSAVE